MKCNPSSLCCRASRFADLFALLRFLREVTLLPGLFSFFGAHQCGLAFLSSAGDVTPTVIVGLCSEALAVCILISTLYET